MTVTKKAPAKGAYTEEQRKADTAEMIRAINARADRAAVQRRAEQLMWETAAEEARERRSRRTGRICLAIGALALAAAYGAMFVQGERILAAYGG